MKRLLVAASFSALILAGLGTPDTRAQDYPTQEEIFLYDGASTLRLTDNAVAAEGLTDINGSGSVVWTEWDGNDYEVFLYDGVTVSRLTDNDIDDYNPRINDAGWVVWYTLHEDDSQIFLYDGATITTIPEDCVDIENVRINNSGWVVWEGTPDPLQPRGIYLFNGTDTTRLIDNDLSGEYPKISDSGSVAWVSRVEAPTPYAELYLYNGETTVRLWALDYWDPEEVADYFDMNNSGWVVWKTGSDIFLYDGTSTTPIQDVPYVLVNTRPLISDNGDIIWLQENTTGDNNLVLYDGTNKVVLQTFSTHYLGPWQPLYNINANGWIVWYKRVEGMSQEIFPYDEIFLYDGTSTLRITDNDEIEDHYPLLSDNGSVVWRANMPYACTDADGDGYGTRYTPLCPNLYRDCDDGNPDVNPGALEGPAGDPTCSDGLDNNCNGGTDLGDSDCHECIDLDGDGYGTNETLSCPFADLDCDDSNPNVHPGVSEIAGNCLDDDCDVATPDRELFLPPIGSAAGTDPVQMATGDLNGDGRTDAVVFAYSNLEILLGQGDGTFVNAASYPVGGGYDGFGLIAVGNLNGDAFPDLLLQAFLETGVFHYLTYYIALPGNGDGTFAISETETVGISGPVMQGTPFEQVVGLKDINGDSLPDLVVIGSGYEVKDVVVRLGSGGGPFQPPQVVYSDLYSESESGLPSGTMADLNGDNTPDLVLPMFLTNTVAVLLGNGDGSFQAPAIYPAGTGPSLALGADLNGDNRNDVAITNRGDNAVLVLLGNGDGSLQPAVSYRAGEGPSFLAAGDLDGNGSVDLALVTGVVNGAGDKMVRVLLNNGGGVLDCFVDYPPEQKVKGIAIDDLNRDGRMDLAVLDPTSDKLLVYLQKPAANPPWGAASVVGTEARDASDRLNSLLAIVLPFCTLLVARRGMRRRRER